MAELTEVRLLIGGQWRDGAEGADVLDKYRLVPYARLHIPSTEQVRLAVADAQSAYERSTLTAYDRGAILDRAADLIESRSAQFIEVIRTEAAPRRPFQGWRYLAAAESPRDLPKGRAADDTLPPELARALADIGLR